MKNQSAYFVDADQESVWVLSFSKRKQLEKKHPKWSGYNCEKNYEDLNEVYEFFKAHGKLVAGLVDSNLFVGLTE